MHDLVDAVNDYVADHQPSTIRPIENLYRSVARRRRRRVVVAGAAVASVAALAAMRVSTPGVHGPAASATPDHRSHVAIPTVPPTPHRIMKMEGARIAPYFLPTLAQFVGSGLIDRIVVGTVTNVAYQVSDDGSDTVTTVMTIHTQDLLGTRPGEDITVRELGGLVRMRQVRSTIEAHTGPIPPDQLDSLIDFTDGTAHPVAGDNELLFLRRNPTGDAATYASMARMTFDASRNTYRWAGTTPNEAWVSGLTRNAVLGGFARLLGVG